MTKRAQGALRASPRAAVLLLVLACGGGDAADEPPAIDVDQPPPSLLSEMNLLSWDIGSQAIIYNDFAVPYDLNTPLFSDYAAKSRAIYLPDGTSAKYPDSGVLDFPVGTVIVKSFVFADDLRTPDENRTIIETRVLRRTTSKWEAWPYIWNDEQTDARLRVGGKTLEVRFTDTSGQSRTASYLVPQRNQCAKCHDRNVGPDGSRVLVPIGPEPRHLNREAKYSDGDHNQLQYLADRGQLTGLPPLSDVPAAYDFRPGEADGVDAIAGQDLERAARDYLDINCAYCHDPFGTNGSWQ